MECILMLISCPYVPHAVKTLLFTLSLLSSTQLHCSNFCIQSQQIQVREFFLKFIPKRRLFTCRICPSTKVCVAAACQLLKGPPLVFPTYSHLYRSFFWKIRINSLLMMGFKMQLSWNLSNEMLLEQHSPSTFLAT